MDFSIIENNVGSIGVFKVDYDDVYITIMIENDLFDDVTYHVTCDV